MSEKIDLTQAQKKLAETLKGIGIDLWGTDDPNKWAEQAFDASASEKTPAEKEHSIKEEMPSKTDRGAKTGTGSIESRKVNINNLWITADETVDWTEALISETSADGLTAPGIWRFYHRMAEKVLNGDLQAYAEVLTTLNPLGDLTDYVSGMILRTPNANRVECEFECREEEMKKDPRGYLGALSVRIARDLLAVLPVDEVRVLGRMKEQKLLEITFQRSQLLKKKMAFLVPADFVEECGGQLQV